MTKEVGEGAGRRIKRNILCHSLVVNMGKMTQIPCLPIRFFEAARSTTKGCKKKRERGQIPFVSLHEMNVEICGLRENTRSTTSRPDKKRKYVKHNSTLKSDCKCGALGASTKL